MSLGPATVAGAGIGALLVAAGCVAAAPYLAGLTRHRPGPRRPGGGGGRPGPPGGAGSRSRWSASCSASLAGAAGGWRRGAAGLRRARAGRRRRSSSSTTSTTGCRIGWSARWRQRPRCCCRRRRPGRGRTGPRSAARRAAAGVEFAALFVLNLVSPRSFGLGDVKLGGVLGRVPRLVRLAVRCCGGSFVGFVLGAVVSVALVAARRATMRTAVPFGPALVARRAADRDPRPEVIRQLAET